MPSSSCSTPGGHGMRRTTPASAWAVPPIAASQNGPKLTSSSLWWEGGRAAYEALRELGVARDGRRNGRGPRLGQKVGKPPGELAAEGNAGGILKPTTRAARVQGGPALAATLHLRWSLKPHSSGSAWVLFLGVEAGWSIPTGEMPGARSAWPRSAALSLPRPGRRVKAN